MRHVAELRHADQCRCDTQAVPNVELTDGTALRNGGPPEGEFGSVDPEGRLFSDFGDWASSTTFEQPNERDLSDMLQRDGKAQQVEQALTLPLRWAPWSIVPQEGDSGEAEFVRVALETPLHEGGMSTPIGHVIAQLSSAVVFRRAFFEKVFRVLGDRVAYKKLAFRPAASCTLRRDKEDGGFAGFTQRISKDGNLKTVPIPREKALVYLHDQARAPLTGRSAMETAYRAFESKQKVRFLWFAFLERHATPWAAAKDERNDAGEADKLAQKVAGLKGGGVVGITGSQSIDLMEPGSDGAAFKECLDWLSAEMSASVLASFTDLAQQGSGKGSFALSADQSDLFLRSRYAVLEEMGAVLTSYAVADLIRWNFPAGRTPAFKFGKLTQEAADAARELLQALSGQQSPPPQEFLDLLVVKVAEHLDLDVDQVAKALQGRKAEAPAEQLQNGISAAESLLREAGVSP
jgi:hypothetical protein